MTLDPAKDLSPPFNAKYGGRCALMSCEKRGTVEIGDVVQYVEDELMHMTCARRVVRQQVAPLCPTCWLYHAGLCR